MILSATVKKSHKSLCFESKTEDRIKVRFQPLSSAFQKKSLTTPWQVITVVYNRLIVAGSGRIVTLEWSLK